MAGGGKGALVDRAVIIGGGIGGLATAIALHKVGINATVYERSELADRLTAAGTMVSIFANGMKALHAMDPAIPIKLRERGAVVKRIMMFSPTGDVISDSINEEMGNALMIQWSRILETFLEFLPPSCIQSGYTCTGVAEVDDEVEVYLVKDGEASTVKAPLVIGSDGVRSIIRDYVLEDKPIGARDLGRRCWRAIIPAPKPLDPGSVFFDVGRENTASESHPRGERSRHKESVQQRRERQARVTERIFQGIHHQLRSCPRATLLDLTRLHTHLHRREGERETEREKQKISSSFNMGE